MQRDIFKPTLLSLVIAQSLLTACSPSPSNSRDTSPATPVIAQPTPVVAAPTMNDGSGSNEQDGTLLAHHADADAETTG